MKNKKLLVLLPAVALMLAGCGNPSDDDHSGSDTSTTDTSGSTTGSTTNTGSTGSTGTTDTSGGQSLPDGVTEADFGTADAPITLAQAKTLIDKLITDLPTESEKTHKFEGLPIFLKSPVKSNKAKNDYGESQFINLKDGTLEFTISFGVYADGVSYGATENDMAGKIATIKGYGALYWKNADTLVYELVKKDNENKPTVLKVEDSSEHHAEPAKLAKTLAELTTVTPGRAQAYTSTARIKSWADNKGNPTSTKTKYGNLILEDDASHELYAYGASATASMLTWNDSLGEYNTAANPQDFLTNALTSTLQVGDTINFWCVVYLYGSTREADVIVTSKVTPTPESVVFSEDAYNLTVGQDLDLSTLVTLTPSGSGTLNYEIVGGTSEYATLTNSSLHGDAAGDVTVKVSVAGTELNDTAVVHVNPLVPESVHFDEDELNLYVDEELDLRSHAVLNPADSGELSYSITAGDSFATLDGYTLTGTADGDVTVKVEVVDYPALYDTITVHVSTAADGVITDIQSTGSSKTMYIDGTDDEKTVTFEVVVTSNGTRSEGVVWEITSGSEFVTISYEDFPGDDTHCVVTLKEGVETTGFVEIVAKAADHPTDYHVEHDVTIDQHVAPNPYGTLENPISVAAALEIAANELHNKNDVTSEPMYIRGIIKGSAGWSAPNSNYTFNIVDDLDDTDSFYCFRIGKSASTDPTASGNDTVIVYGYATLYGDSKTLELCTKNSVNAIVASLTRGTSPITQSISNGTITGLPTSAENGTLVSFTVAADSGYKIDAVRLNGVDLVDDEGTYSFTVDGDANISVVTSDASKTYQSVAKYNFTSTVTSATSISDYAGLQGLLDKQSGSDLITGASNFTKVFKGANGGSSSNKWNTGNCLKLGTSSAGGTITLALSEEVCRVVITGYVWANTVTLDVGSTTGVSCADMTIANKSNVEGGLASEITVDFTATDSLTIACGVKSLVITSIDFIALK